MLIGTRNEIGTSGQPTLAKQPSLVVVYVPYENLVSGPRDKPIFTTSYMLGCLVDRLCELRSQDTRLAVFLPASMALARAALGRKGFLEHTSPDERRAMAASNIQGFMLRWHIEFATDYKKSRKGVDTAELPVNSAELIYGEQSAIAEKVFEVFDRDAVPIAYEDPRISLAEDSRDEQRLAEQFAAVLHSTQAFHETQLVTL